MKFAPVFWLKTIDRPKPIEQEVNSHGIDQCNSESISFSTANRFLPDFWLNII